MKTLLCATLAVLLVAAVTAQSSQQTNDASAIEGLIEKLNNVVSSLGGFEGTINKLEYITKLVQKAYTDQGIGGWMARNLIKLELSQLKEKALESEKEMINHLLDQLESKTGLKTYSEELAEDYILSDTVKKAIDFIRQNIQEIISEISKAQKEHDDAAGKISKDALGKITDRLNGLKEKLRGLSKKLLDKLTGRDNTADVYGADGGIRYQEIQVSEETYILSELIKVAAQQLRERIFKYIELIAEATREAHKAFGKTREQALKHIEELKKRLRQSVADLKDTLLGRKTNEELEEEIKEDVVVDASYALLSADSEVYVLDGVVKELIGQLRVKILDLIRQLGEAKREAGKAAGDAKKAAKEHLNKLREQIRRLTKDLKDAILGRKTKEELEEEIKEDEAVSFSSTNYDLDPKVKELIAKLRAKILDLIVLLGKAKQQAEDLLDENNRVPKLKEELRNLTEELKEAMLGRKTEEELEKAIKGDGSYAVQSAELDPKVKELIEKLRAKILDLIVLLGKAKREAGRLLGEEDKAESELPKLKEQLKSLTKELKDAMLGRKSAEELENLVGQDSLYEVQPQESMSYAVSKSLLAKFQERMKQLTDELMKAGEEVVKASEEAKEAAKERFQKLRERLNQLKNDLLAGLRGRKSTKELEKALKASF